MTKEKQLYTDIKIEKLPHSEIEITGSIPLETLAEYRKEALKGINNEIHVDGFRKGMVPEKVIIAKVGEMTILEETTEIVMSKAYPRILIDNKIDAIGRPEIRITKMAPGTALEFKVKTAVMPEVKLPDYKKIAKEEFSKPDEKHEVTDKEVEDVITQIRKSRVDHAKHDHDKLSKEEHDKLVESSMPEFNDELVKSLGDFKDVVDFKAKVKENMLEEKKHKAFEKKRIAVADHLTEKTDVELPSLVVESELDKMMMQFEGDIARMGVKVDDYLGHIKKTREDLRVEWRPDALKRAKLQMALNKIAVAEDIHPDESEVKKQVDYILAQYADASEERARVYVETLLTNEKVFEFLEKQK